MSFFGDDGANQALGMIGASAISYASTMHGAYKQYKYQKKLQEQAASLNYKYGRKAALNQYGWTRKSLENADYNPMLAVSQGPVGMSSGFTSPGSAQSEDYSSAVDYALDYARYGLEKKLNKSSVNKLNADKDLVDTQIVGNNIDNYFNPYIKSATIANIQSATALQEQQTLAQIITNKYLPDKLKSEIYNNFEVANASLGQAQASLIQSNTNSAVASDKVYDNQRYIAWSKKHPYLYSVDKTMRRYGAGVVAGLAAYGSAKAKSQQRPKKR